MATKVQESLIAFLQSSIIDFNKDTGNQFEYGYVCATTAAVAISLGAESHSEEKEHSSKIKQITFTKNGKEICKVTEDYVNY